ncbi:MAG: hypothetical protein R3C59_13915 [Planctomycetaceae bacterium]
MKFDQTIQQLVNIRIAWLSLVLASAVVPSAAWSQVRSNADENGPPAVVGIPQLPDANAVHRSVPTRTTGPAHQLQSRLQLAGLADQVESTSGSRARAPVPVVQTANPPSGNATSQRTNFAEFQRNAITPQPQRSKTTSNTGPSSKYILRETSAEEELNLRIGLPHILTLRQPPLRTYIPESGAGIVAVRYIDPESPHRLAIEPLSIGTTMLTMWFASDTSPDGEEPVSWLVHVADDSGSDGPAAVARNRGYEVQLQALQREVNYAFPNSSVQLSWVGSQVLLRGKAKDVEEASQIARIVGASIPGSRGNREEEFLENFGRSQFRGRSGNEGSAINNVINMPGESDYLSVDSNLIREAGSLAGALRGDTSTGINQGRINNRVINMLEIAGVHQIMLKVTVAEVNRSASRAIGADLQIGSAGDAVRFFTTLGTSAAGGTLVLDQSDFDLAISALKRLNLARSLAEPTLTTLNGQPANFNVGGSFPVPVVTGQTATGLQGVDFQNFGVQLQFVPIVTDGDRVRLTLQASVSTRDETAGAQVNNTNVPGLNTRNFSNTVELREGQTLAVAGLIQNNLGGTSSRVPFVGDIPFVGRLFSNDGTSYDEQELVILVTPYLVGPVDRECPTPALPGSDYFEPDDVEFFLRGSLTGHMAEDYRSPIRTDLQKMKAFRRCEQRLIIGQPGHSNGLLCPPAHLPGNGQALAGERHFSSDVIPQPMPYPPPLSMPESSGSMTLQPIDVNGGQP